MKTILITSLLFFLVLSVNGASQTRFDFPLNPGDIQIYTVTHYLDSAHTKYVQNQVIRTVTLATKDEMNFDNDDDTVKVFYCGDHLNHDEGVFPATINKENRVVEFISKDRWIELLPTTFSDLSRSLLLNYIDDQLDTVTNAAFASKIYPSTIFNQFVQTCDLRVQDKRLNKRYSLTIADMFGIVAAKLESPSNDYEMVLTNGVFHGKSYNREAGPWNYMNLCSSNVYQILRRCNNPYSKKIITVTLKDTTINGNSYFKFSDMITLYEWSNYIREDQNGVYIFINNKDSLIVHSDAGLGSVVGRSVVWRVDTIEYYNEKKRLLRFKNDIFISNFTSSFEIGEWTEDIGPTFNMYDRNNFYYTDTLIYAKICGKEYGNFATFIDEPVIQPTFILHQNSPNPFSTSTNIRYTISQTSNVRIEIFDLLGRKIATLTDEEKDAGEYISKFEVRSAKISEGHSADLRPGIYFYRLSAGKKVETRKMIVMN